jgi:hypothetical protein
MFDTGLLDNFVARGVFGPVSFVSRILYTRSHATKYFLNTHYFFLVSLTCVVTSDHKQRKESCHNMCHLQYLAALTTAVLPPAAAEVAVEAAVAEAGTGGEAMVVEITAETEAAVGAYNNQP